MKSSRGSALIAVMILSSIVLIVFATFHDTVRDTLRLRNDTDPAGSVALDTAKEAYRSGDTPDFPDGTRLVNLSESGGEYRTFIASGSTRTFTSAMTGSLALSLKDGASVRYAVTYGGITAIGTLTGSTMLSVTGSATTLALSTLGGGSLVGLTASLIGPKEEFVRLEKDVANVTLPLRTFRLTR